MTVCGHNKEELVANENKFCEITEKYRLTLNESKTVSAVQTLPILGYLVSKGEIKPDPERLRPLRNLGAPFNLDSQHRIVGMFAYYSKWIHKFSEKIRPLSTNRVFPLPQEALTTFESLRGNCECYTCDC